MPKLTRSPGVAGISPVADAEELLGAANNVYQTAPEPAQRHLLWKYACKVEEKKAAYESSFYTNLVSIDKTNEATAQITLDLDRTLTDNPAFLAVERRNTRLFEILKAYAFHNSGLGYCQGMSSLVAGLMTEIPQDEDVFWILVDVMDRCKLKEYYSKGMEGLIREANIFYFILKKHDSELVEHMDRFSLNVLMFITPWYLTLFTSLPNWPLVLRIYDCFLVDGPKALHRFCLAILKSIRDQLLALKGIENLLPFVLNLPPEILNEEFILSAAAEYDINEMERMAMEDIKLSTSGGVSDALKCDKKSTATFGLVSQSSGATQRLTAMPSADPQTPSKQFPFMRWMTFDMAKMLIGGGSDEETEKERKVVPESERGELAASAPARLSHPEDQQQPPQQPQQSTSSVFSLSKIITTLTPVKKRGPPVVASPSPYQASRFVYSSSKGSLTPQMTRETMFNNKVRAAMQSPKNKNSLRKKGRDLSKRNLLKKKLSNRNVRTAMSVNSVYTKDSGGASRPIKRKTRETGEEEEEGEKEEVSEEKEGEKKESGVEKAGENDKKDKMEEEATTPHTPPTTPSRKRKKGEDQEPDSGNSSARRKGSGLKMSTTTTPGTTKRRRSGNAKDVAAAAKLSAAAHGERRDDDDSFLSSTDEASPFTINKRERRKRDHSGGKSQPIKKRKSDYDGGMQKENKTPIVSHSKKMIRSSAQEDDEKQSLKLFTTPLKERTTTPTRGRGSSSSKEKGSHQPLVGGVYLLSPYFFSPSRSSGRPSSNLNEDVYEMSALK